MPRRRGKSTFKHSRSIIWGAIFVIAAILGLALIYGPNLSEGIVTCQGDECIQAGHFHATVAMTICGIPYQFPLEGGLLPGQHTHKESNRIHWHSSAPVGDNGQAFTLERMLSDFAITLPAECNGKPIATNVAVNGQPRPEGLQYSWKDGDSIVIEIE
ncbi:hypothetical protein HYZ64_02825 [Candidatus Berkelbacteria bacterium]|nr:hypothetical protein [Candidatus Berkelbacteria bacterium]